MDVLAILMEIYRRSVEFIKYSASKICEKVADVVEMFMDTQHETAKGAKTRETGMKENVMSFLQHPAVDKYEIVSAQAANMELISAQDVNDFKTCKGQIELDLDRTFSNESTWIRTRCGKSALRNVLLAYAVQHPENGYVQSMSFIAGRFLCYAHRFGAKETINGQIEDGCNDTLLKNYFEGVNGGIQKEASAFWIMKFFLEQLFPEMYGKDLLGVKINGFLLKKLIIDRMPKLTRHLEQCDIGFFFVMMATNWFLPLFCSNFPEETSFYFLDAIIINGKDFIFSIALALLEMAENGVLTQDPHYGRICKYLKKRDQVLINADQVLKLAYTNWKYTKKFVSKARAVMPDLISL